MTTRPITEIGAAVVGTGFIGAVHVEALRRLGVQVHGVVGSSHVRAAERAAALGLPPAYESFEAMLADPRVDVVHITSPNHLHFPQAGAALAAGKHVVCEKPLARTSAETGELVRLARASGLVHAVNFNIRFYPINRHLHQLVREGELGDVRLVSGHYLQDWLLLDTDWNWRLEPELGGSLRAVADIGSHWMDVTSHVAGQRIVAVMADLKTFIPVRRQPIGSVETFSNKPSGATTARTIRTEDAATILLRYENGAIGNLTISQISAGRRNTLEFEIDGSTSAAAWNSERPDELWIGHRGKPNELLPRDPALLNAEGRDAASLPPDIARASRTLSRRCIGRSTAPSPGMAGPSPTIRRSPTATSRCWSARRLAEASARVHGRESIGPPPCPPPRAGEGDCLWTSPRAGEGKVASRL